MSPENQTNTTKICPTCGTRLGINATRCSVCGSNLAPSVAVATAKPVSGPKIPEVTLSLPLIFGLAILLIVVGAGAVYGVLKGLGDKSPLAAAAMTATSTQTVTPTITITPTASLTPTPESTWTPLPPLEYTVAGGDSCLGIAAVYNVSPASIIQLNNLSSDCVLSVGKVLKIPQPTATPSPLPTNTLNPTEIAAQECSKVEVIVKDGDTLGGISANYAVSKESILAYNGKANDTIMVGEKLIIPLCEQQLETPTATAVPPYGAANLLLPADGASFTKTSDIVTLQWASVGTLRQNEAYAVTIEDVTSGDARKWVDYVTDTKFNVPDTYRPNDDSPHVYRWTVLTVRQNGTDKDSGKAVWEPAGDVSAQRVFSWMGIAGAAPAITPSAAPTGAGTGTPQP
jgi:LysM repeat protein